MGVVQMKDIMELPKILSKIVGAGPVGWGVGALVIVLVLFVALKWSNIKKAKTQKETEKERVEAQADNATENATDEEDAANAKQDIEDLIKKGR